MYMYKRSARIDHYTTCKSIIFLKKRAVYFVFYFPKSIFLRCKAALIETFRFEDENDYDYEI